MPAIGSWMLGTIGLWVALAVAVTISRSRPLRRLGPTERHRVHRWGLLAWIAQLAHFAEEYRTGFSTAFPAFLGLPAWSPTAFRWFNLAWLGLWLVALWAAPRGHRLLEWPLWFLAIALMANGVAHPLLALRSGGYFPGLYTAVPVGVAGVLLFRTLRRDSVPRPDLQR